ncbi:MAG: hypothetical protein IT337_12420 [Thermomicrobiales bacterium]|nr:hypothetical protein [Thermomicrobiales bacterium]
MKYRIVQNVDGSFIVTEPADIFAWADIAGIEIVRLNSNPRQRAELQGQPVLKSFCGPMWDGDAIRYEDQRSNDILSA